MNSATTIANWGNSVAIRIPKEILRAAGLHSGDKVTVSTTKIGSIEINSAKTAHRRVKPASGVSYETLFDGFDKDLLKGQTAIAPWPNDDLVGAEYEAWS